MTLTGDIADFVAGFSQADLPDEALAFARTAVTDLTAVMLAAASEPAIAILSGGCRPVAEGATALLDDARRFDPADAARISGTAAHALDYDDVAFRCHPSAVLVPAIMAEAESRHLSGRAVLGAYIVGFEVWGEIAGREADPYHDAGWQPTSVIGPVATAAAISFLRRLDVDRTRAALSLSCSAAGGVIANFGSMTKPYHVGKAARAAIEAVDLAERGMSAGEDAIGAANGLLAALSPKGRYDIAGPLRLGAWWQAVPSPLTFKSYPVCFAAHRIIDAVLTLAEAERIAPDDVAEVHVQIRKTQGRLLRFSDPQDGLEAKFSAHFAVASALIRGAVGLSELTTSFIRSEAVRAMTRRVHFPGRLDDCPCGPDADRVVIALRDGRHVDSGELPGLTRPFHLEEKFLDCCAAGGIANGAALFAAFMRLEEVADVAAIAGMVRRGDDPA